MSITLMMVGMVTVSAAERMWTRSEILVVADKEAGRLGYDVERMGVDVDVYNTAWNQHVKAFDQLKVNETAPSGEIKQIPYKSRRLEEVKKKLSGHSFWAVLYSPLKVQLGGSLFVFIDRGTGEIIDALRQEESSQR